MRAPRRAVNRETPEVVPGGLRRMIARRAVPRRLTAAPVRRTVHVYSSPRASVPIGTRRPARPASSGGCEATRRTVIPPRPGSLRPYVSAGSPRRVSGTDVPMFPALSRTSATTRYGAGGTGRPRVVRAVPRHDRRAVGDAGRRDLQRRPRPHAEDQQPPGPRRSAESRIRAGAPPGCGSSSGPRSGVGPDRQDARRRRRAVHAEGLRDDHAAPLAAERHADPVGAVRHGASVGVQPVPGEARKQLPVGVEAAAGDELAHLVALLVDDRDVHGVAALEAEGHALAVEAPVPVGRDDRVLHLEGLHDRG